MTRRSKQVSEAWCLPLTRQPMELCLKSPSSSCIFFPFSSRSIQQWDAECPLFSFADSEIDAKGQGTKVSFKSQTSTELLLGLLDFHAKSPAPCICSCSQYKLSLSCKVYVKLLCFQPITHINTCKQLLVFSTDILQRMISPSLN